MLKKINFTYLFLIILMGLALTFLYYYSKENSSLINQNKKLTDERNELLVADIGDAVPPLSSVNVNGNPIELRFHDNKKYLIFIYSAYCEFCKAEYSLWNDLIAEVSNEKVETYGLSLNSQIDTDNSIDHKYQLLRSKTIIGSDKNIMRTYRAASVPLIIVVSDQGIIEWVQKGRLNSEKIQELKSKL